MRNGVFLMLELFSVIINNFFMGIYKIFKLNVKWVCLEKVIVCFCFLNDRVYLFYI